MDALIHPWPEYFCSGDSAVSSLDVVAFGLESARSNPGAHAKTRRREEGRPIILCGFAALRETAAV